MQSFYLPPGLQTERLVLRQPMPGDAQALLPMRSDEVVMRYIPRPLAACVEDVEAIIQMMADGAAKGERLNWVIEWKDTGQAIGFVGFVRMKPEHDRAEVGYSLAREWHRQGIMREALKAVLSFGFEQMRLHSIEAIIYEENAASEQLLVDAGFRKEGLCREDFLFNGVYRNSIHFGLLASEFYAREPALREISSAF